MKLRLGIVGLGTHWENRHRPALRALSDRFEVRAVCEQVSHLAKQAARDFSVPAVDGFQMLARRDDIDALLMLSEQWYGKLPIAAAAQFGKAVYCAAPLDVGIEEIRGLKSRVDEAGIAFMSEFPRRHAPATIRLKELIATRLGPPRLLFCHLRKPTVQGLNGLASSRNKNGSARMADLVELVDWCRYVVGQEPTSVFGMMHRGPHAGADDYQMLSLDFSQPGESCSGPVAQVSCGSYVPADWHEAVSFRPPAGLQVSCEHGIAFVDMPAQLIWFDAAGRHQESLDSERPVGELLLLRFYRAVTSLVRPTSGMDDAYRALELVLQAHTSHREGRRVMLDSLSG